MKQCDKCRNKRDKPEHIQCDVHAEVLRKDSTDSATECATEAHKRGDDSEKERESTSSSAQIVGNENIQCAKYPSTDCIKELGGKDEDFANMSAQGGGNSILPRRES
mmetsp:Transcript_30022/g.87739  ORF Transcript_30022/g.87739 Transcript_30022/m.87739 type:complete len:107 (+) Transcript_30022:1911-2231(+)